MARRVSSRASSAAVAGAADVVAVVVFVTLGRDSHGEALDGAGIAGVAAPFLIGLAAGWLVARAWRAPSSVRVGVVVWPVTVALGMLLRHVAWHRGTALAFIVVATVFLGVFLVGWRAVRSGVVRRRAARGRDVTGRSRTQPSSIR